MPSNAKQAALSALYPNTGLTMNAAHQGLAPFGFRYEESVFAPPSAKGKGYYGPLPNGGEVSTELSAHDDNAQGFPLLAPGLDRQEVNSVLDGSLSDAIYQKAMAWATARRRAGLSPFAQPNELRLPNPLR